MCPHEIQIYCENSIGHNNGATLRNTGFLQTQSLSPYIHLRTWNSDINCERFLRIHMPTERIEFSFVDWMCSVCYARYVNFNQTTFHGCGLWGFASASAIRCAPCVCVTDEWVCCTRYVSILLISLFWFTLRFALVLFIMIRHHSWEFIRFCELFL